LSWSPSRQCDEIALAWDIGMVGARLRWMRAVLAAFVPTFLLVAGGFFACGGTTVPGADGGDKDHEAQDTGPSDVYLEAPSTDDGGMLACTIPGNEMSVKYDPVAYCVMRDVLQNQHANAFSSKTGTFAGWNYNTLLPETGDGGAPLHSVQDDVSYGSSCTDFYQWSQLYADPTSLDDDGGGTSTDLADLAPILEKELAPLPPDYDGELYFNLRNVALGLKILAINGDSAKIGAIADAYARQIYTSFYFPLPLAGGDAGSKEGGASEGGSGADGAPSDAGTMDAGGSGDPGGSGDGILGVNQQPVTGSPGILYQPDKVASAAYALLDLAANNPTDKDVNNWIAAARRALDHIHDKARDPASGLYHASLLTTGSSSDALGDLTAPAELLSSDVEATVILYLIRSQERVTSAAEPEDAGPEAGVPLDAPLIGPLASMGDFPFLPRIDALIAGMDALWDGSPELLGDGGKDAGAAGREGYMDGLVPSTHTLVTTKSTRPNAYMFASLHLQLLLEGRAFTRVHELNAARVLLANELPGQLLMNPGMNTSFLNAVSGQQAYFDTLSQGFALLPADQSYTAAAVAATIAGFNEQLVGFQQH
jgi:hypothetical protein